VFPNTCQSHIKYALSLVSVGLQIAKETLQCSKILKFIALYETRWFIAIYIKSQPLALYPDPNKYSVGA
jgi:hypothetical protein